MENTDRRSFLKKSAVAMAGVGLYASIPHNLYATGAPGDRLNIGVIGLGFGINNMTRMINGDKNVHCTALCDVNQVLLEEQAKELKEKFPDNTGSMKLYTDFRKLLDDKEINGVIIATPDHWHTYIYAEACKAGKAIYIEKPTGHTISDCNLMVDLQRKHNNVVTTGLWQISIDYFKDAFNILRTGVLGDVYKVHAWITGGTEPFIYKPGPQPVPETFDYKMWLGPGPSTPYSEDKVNRWSRFWEFGGGQQTMWVHYIDSAFDGIAALGHQRTYPKSIYSVGYKHPESMSEVPAIQTSVFEFDKYHVVWEHQVARMYNRGDGVAWIGSNGTLVCNRVGYEIIPVTGRNGDPLIAPIKKQGSYANQFEHIANWGECIRTKNPNTNSPIDKGSYATLLCCAANISYRTGSQSLEYLPTERKFRDNPEADAYITEEYHNGWNYPTL